MAEKWTNAHTFMYFLFGFSHLTDWKVTDEEKEESIRIARADGHFHENEKAWITEMASIMGFSFDNLEHCSGVILHE